ncbi:MAG: hypothetical protein CMO38_00060 [Verrucomicrobiaceae bacterium]|nr:hypothetical protein [Verrucomicrobiaceae bacterium]
MPSKKKAKWNISEEEGQIIIIKELKDILSLQENNRLLIGSIAKLFKKNISHNIKHFGKNTTLFAYVVNMWGGIEQFADRFEGLSVFIKEKKKYIMMIDENTIFNKHPKHTYCGWEIIDIPEIKTY